MQVIGSSGSGKSKFLEHLMRQDILHRQGFALLDPHGTLYDDVLKWAAHESLDRKIIPLDLSRPAQVVGFNPFKRVPGDISVQIDNRITATMHAWNVENTDETPTLARTLRLIYAVMIEHNLGLPQVRHLIDFNARDIRAPLIERLSTPFIQQEWYELQEMKARDWREETLSARNRLCKLLTSSALARVMGLPDRGINLSEIIEENAILLVKLRRGGDLSKENARVFGALLVNEFFECAMRRDTSAGDPSPYHLYLDEFQNFISLDIADMLDEVRKFGMFLTLSHQRFGQLDEDVIDAVLTNCKNKAVFGGLRADSAELMAKELFIGKLDPMKVKAAIYQTKFWPVYGRDQVYTHGTAHGTTSGTTSATGGGGTASASVSAASSEASFYDNWFAMPRLSGTRTETNSSGTSSMTAKSSNWAESSSESDSSSESESVADVPIFIPVPFQELSSVQFMPIDEQLHQMTVALKEQFPRHCFVKIQGQETQPLLVPKVEDPYLTEESLIWYRDYQLQQQHALPVVEVDRLLGEQETVLLQKLQALEAKAESEADEARPLKSSRGPINAAQTSLDLSTIWPRVSSSPSSTPLETTPRPAEERKPARRRRGPPRDLENHLKLVRIVQQYGSKWITEEALWEICEALQKEAVPIVKTWPTRSDEKSQSWTSALRNYRHLVMQAIRDRFKAAGAELP
jgi:hypothetical protein